MIITYTNKEYTPEAVIKRYALYNKVDGCYRFFEVGKDKRYSMRKGMIRRRELPGSVALAAEKTHGVYVEWPLD